MVREGDIVITGKKTNGGITYTRKVKTTSGTYKTTGTKYVKDKKRSSGSSRSKKKTSKEELQALVDRIKREAEQAPEGTFTSEIGGYTPTKQEIEKQKDEQKKQEFVQKLTTGRVSTYRGRTSSTTKPDEKISVLERESRARQSLGDVDPRLKEVEIKAAEMKYNKFIKDQKAKVKKLEDTLKRLRSSKDQKAILDTEARLQKEREVLLRDKFQIDRGGVPGESLAERRQRLLETRITVESLKKQRELIKKLKSKQQQLNFIKDTFQSPEFKALTKQSVTPDELKTIENNIRKRDDLKLQLKATSDFGLGLGIGIFEVGAETLRAFYNLGKILKKGADYLGRKTGEYLGTEAGRTFNDYKRKGGKEAASNYLDRRIAEYRKAGDIIVKGGQLYVDIEKAKARYIKRFIQNPKQSLKEIALISAALGALGVAGVNKLLKGDKNILADFTKKEGAKGQGRYWGRVIGELLDLAVGTKGGAKVFTKFSSKVDNVIRKIDNVIFSPNEFKKLEKIALSLLKKQKLSRDEKLLLGQYKIMKDLKFKTTPDLDLLKTQILEGKITPKQLESKLKILNKVEKDIIKIKDNQKAVKSLFEKPSIKIIDNKKPLSELFKSKTNIDNLEKTFKEFPVNEIKKYNLKKKSINKRIDELKTKLINPNTTEKAKSRINKEINLLKDKVSFIEKTLKRNILNLENLNSKQRKDLFNKLTDTFKDLEDFSNVQEKIIRLDRKIKKALPNFKDLSDKNLEKAISVYEKAISFTSLSKAQRGKLLKDLDKVLKSSLKPKKTITKPKKAFKVVVEENRLSKTQLENILKTTNTKEKLQKRLKNLDRKINEIKALKGQYSEKEINSLIRDLELSKKNLIEQYNKGVPKVKQDQILRRFKESNKETRKVQVLTPDVLSGKSKGVKKIRFGDYEVEINLKNLGAGLRTQQVSSLELPQVFKIRRINKEIPNRAIKNYNDNLRKSGNKGLRQSNRNFRNIDKQRDLYRKTLRDKKTSPNLKSKIRKNIKTLDRLEELNIKKLNQYLKAVSQISNLNLYKDLFDQVQLKTPSFKFDFALIQKQIPKLRNELANINDTIKKIKDEIEKVKDKPIKTPDVPKFKTKKIPKIRKALPKQIIKGKLKPIAKKEKLKVPLPKLRKNIDSSTLKDKVLTFEGLFRERINPNLPFSKKNSRTIKRRYTGTKNAVLNKVLRLGDKQLVRSGKLEVVGIGKAKKDEPLDLSLYRKFRINKNKNSPALRFVELSKFALDSPGEVKGLQKLKKLKKKLSSKPKKKVVKKKSSTKKKVSKAKPKTIKKSSPKKATKKKVVKSKPKVVKKKSVKKKSSGYKKAKRGLKKLKKYRP